jgi:hypothetical protein
VSTPRVATVPLDVEALFRALDRVEGRRFLGAVDGGGCVELVFEGEHGRNLISIYVAGGDYYRGRVAFGGVADPKDYVRSYADWRPWRARS